MLRPRFLPFALKIVLLAAVTEVLVNASTLDEDGVAMLFPAKARGTSYRLGTNDPRDDPEHIKLWADTLTRMSENGVTFWRSTGHPVSYASGAPGGTSHRLMIFASGGRQTFNWQTGAIEKGYCGNPSDLNAFEATVYCRLHTLTVRHESGNWVNRMRCKFSVILRERAPRVIRSRLPLPRLTEQSLAKTRYAC